LANAHAVLASSYVMNAESRGIAEEAIACNSGQSRKRNAAYDQAKLAIFCGPKSVMRGSASAEIAINNVSSRTSSRAHDHAVIARSCPSNSVIVAIEAAAIDSSRGELKTTRRAKDQTSLARRRVSKSDIRARAALESASLSGPCPNANFAIDHEIVVKLYGLNSSILVYTSDNSIENPGAFQHECGADILAMRCNAVAKLMASCSARCFSTKTKISWAESKPMIWRLSKTCDCDRSDLSCCLSVSVRPPLL